MSSTELAVQVNQMLAAMSPEQRNAMLNLQNAAMDSLSSGINSLSFKGREFNIKIDGTEYAHPDKYLNVILVAVEGNDVRQKFEGTYSSDEKNVIQCWSVDDKLPAPEVPTSNRGGVTCDSCQFNVKGSGQGDSKACTRKRRAVVAIPSGEAGKVELLLTSISASSIYSEREPAAGILSFRDVLKQFKAISKNLGTTLPLFSLWVQITFVSKESVPITQFSFFDKVNGGSGLRPVEPELQQDIVAKYSSGQVQNLLDTPVAQAPDDGAAAQPEATTAPETDAAPAATVTPQSAAQTQQAAPSEPTVAPNTGVAMDLNGLMDL